MRQIRLVALAAIVAAACGGDSRRGSSTTGGGAIGADGNAVDGAIHSAFDNQGDGLGSDAVNRGGGDASSRSLDGSTGATDGAPDGADGEDALDAADGGTSTGADGQAPDQDGASCEPDCTDKLCGDDGCGGSCGTCPAAFPVCFEGLCSTCLPDCAGLSCGDDGCGGTCGTCAAGELCEAGACVCVPSCPEDACSAPDGCGGLCPPCDTEDVSSDALQDATDGELADTADDTMDSGADGSQDTVGPNPPSDGAGSSDADPDGASAGDTGEDGTSEDGGQTNQDGATDPGSDAAADGAGGDGDGEADGGSGSDAGAGGDAASDGGSSDGGDPQDDAGPPLEAPSPGELVITELMRDPLDGAGPGRQWFEVVSVVDEDRDLSGCTFSDANETSFVVPELKTVVAFERLIFAEEGGDEDGLLGADILYPTIASGGPDLSVSGTISLECAGEVVDSIDLAVVEGDSAFPQEPGRAMQLDSSATNASANDSPGAWCSSYKLYGAAGYGTPGVGNHPCDSEVDFCRIWSPGFKLAKVGELWEVFTHLNEEGLTDVTLGAPDSSPTLKAQVGFGLDGSLPAEIPEQWTWFTGVAVEDPPAAVPQSDDRYVAVITMTTPGVYDVAGRFSLDDGFTWTYCDLDGSTNGYSATTTGHATVTP